MSVAQPLSPPEKEAHGWFAGRAELIAAELDRVGRAEAALDAGCGGGLTLVALSRRAQTVTGVDSDPQAVRAAQGRGLADVQCASVDALPFAAESFDLICCLDVLEHVPDDQGALAELRRVARTRSALLLAVPALPRLWSGHDLAAGHRRRYTRRSLLGLTSRTGWRPERVTYANALLLAPIAATRLANRAARRPPRTDLLTAPAAAGPLLQSALTLEARLLRAGVRFPLGLSLMATLRADN